MDAGPVIEGIQKIFETSRLRTTEVAVSLAGHAVIIKRVSIPSMNPEELAESIHWEAEQYIPFDIGDVNLDYQILGTVGEGDQMDVLLVAVKKDKIQDFTSVVSQAGRVPVVVDVDILAVQNAYEINYGIPHDQTFAIVNVGAATTNISIVSRGNSRFWRDLSVGGNQYTEAIQRELGVSFEEAEGAKLGKVESGVSTQSVAPILESVSADVVAEIQKTTDFFMSSQGEGELSKIVLAGGGSRLDALASAVKERFGCPVEFLDPFHAVSVDNRQFPSTLLAEVGPAAAVAVGLATRKAGDR
jgi:type IV pilus assembly protein PilM